MNHGGTGIDTVQYSGSSAAVAVNLLAGTASGGDAAGDVLVDVENLTGSNFADVLVGNDGANRLDGGVGTDTLWGGAGTDVLNGGVDNDGLRGGAGADVLDGGAGAGQPADRRRGCRSSHRRRWDRYRDLFRPRPPPASVNLATGLGSGGEAEGDTLDGIERIGGSNFNRHPDR